MIPQNLTVKCTEFLARGIKSVGHYDCTPVTVENIFTVFRPFKVKGKEDQYVLACGTDESDHDIRLLIGKKIEIIGTLKSDKQHAVRRVRCLELDCVQSNFEWLNPKFLGKKFSAHVEHFTPSGTYECDDIYDYVPA